ncbi:hypothetical protein AB0J21_28050 [Streptomyces sp. NPDC049954]|uniref:hypothetical protein n=1 Tax=Streptomyces sp. NPDC049954 TaxID=3155779 RepID=UPI00342BA1AA
MARTVVAWVTGLLLLAETLGVILLCLTLGTVVDNQTMSLAGTDPGLVVDATYVLAVVAGLFLALCATVALLCALRRRAPGRTGRVLLIVAAVLHGVLAALTFALTGPAVSVFLLVVLGLLVWLLLAENRAAGGQTGGDSGPASDADGDPAPAGPPGISPSTAP